MSWMGLPASTEVRLLSSLTRPCAKYTISVGQSYFSFVSRSGYTGGRFATSATLFNGFAPSVLSSMNHIFYGIPFTCVCEFAAVASLARSSLDKYTVFCFAPSMACTCPFLHSNSIQICLSFLAYNGLYRFVRPQYCYTAASLTPPSPGRAQMYLLVRRRHEFLSLIIRGITGSGKRYNTCFLVNHLLSLVAHKQEHKVRHVKPLHTPLDSGGVQLRSI